MQVSIYYRARATTFEDSAIPLSFPKPPAGAWLEGFRQRLASSDALPHLALLAVIAGALTGVVALAFRSTIGFALGRFLLPGGSEQFESLSYAARMAMPMTGAMLLGALFTWLPSESLRFGVSHVMERLSRHQGRLPVSNALVQFFGGIIALASGISGGREGPAIHLGAASASLMGQGLGLPNNALRTLVACGTAAAIAGSFNTPMAGVIFAMEVVMMEYTFSSFIPVILAAVTSTLMTHYYIGPEPAFQVAPLRLASLLEIPYVVLCGAVIGTLAAAYIQIVQWFARLNGWPFWLRALLAGTVTAAGAMATPEVMGVGYDTVDAAMAGQVAAATLLAVVVLKSLTSGCAVGLGLPVGIIGPTFVIGAAMGGLMGMLGESLHGTIATASTGFYVMLGMAAMMAAVLQAPLAALVAVLELTENPNVVLPAMLTIVVATMVTSVVFRQRSVFLSTLTTLGLEYPPNPVRAHLRRAGVASIMNRSFVRLPQTCARAQAGEAIAARPRWIVVENGAGEPRCVLGAGDLRAFLDDAGQEVQEIDLMSIPAMRRDLAGIDYLATVDEAQTTLRAAGVEALCVRRTSAPMISPVRGIITQEDIDNYRESAL